MVVKRTGQAAPGPSHKETGKEPLHPAFGNLVTRLMDSVPLGIPETARKIGTTPEMVRRYRLGEAMPGRERMKKLATLLGVSPKDLYGGAEEIQQGSARTGPGAPLMVDDPDEVLLLTTYRKLDETARKIVRARAVQLLEQFGKPDKGNPFGKGTQ